MDEKAEPQKAIEGAAAIYRANGGAVLIQARAVADAAKAVAGADVSQVEELSESFHQLTGFGKEDFAREVARLKPKTELPAA